MQAYKREQIKGTFYLCALFIAISENTKATENS